MTTNMYGATDRVSKAGDTMTGTLALAGTPPLQISAGAAPGDVLTSDGSGNAAWQQPLKWVSVTAYGAVGNGTTDDTTAINNALAACPAGGVVWLAPGLTYATSAPITIPPQVTLQGFHGAHLDTLQHPQIKPLASFTGAAVILMVDQATGGYSITSNEQRIRGVTIDCSNLTGSTIDGIQAQGLVHGVYLDDVAIRSAPSHGIAVVSNGSGSAYSWRGTRVRVISSGGIGFSVAMTDCTWIDCESLSAGSHGWFLGSCANTHLVGCRSEWSAFDGFNLSGSTGTGTGSGGFTMTGCSTDRNGHNGVFFNSLTGNGPVVVTGLMVRRDGRNGGSGGGNYAGLQITSTTAPVVVNGLTCYPGVDDNGSGTSSPQYGVSITSTCTKVSLDSATIHAATTAWNDDGTNTVLLGPMVQLYTGATSSPTAVASPGFTATGSGHLQTPGHAFGVPLPRDFGLVAWAFDPGATLSSKIVGTAGTIYLAALYIPTATTLTKLMWGIGTAGATPTAGQNFVGLYSSAGTRLASVGVDARVTTTGTFTETISVAVTPGMYWVAWVFNASTLPSLYRGQDTNATAAVLGQSGASARFATNATSQTSLPSTITPASNTVAQYTYWAAVG